MQITQTSFIELIRNQLAARNLSARAAAANAGLPERSVQGVLEGRAPTIERAAQICEAVGLELQIFSKEDSSGLSGLAAMQKEMARMESDIQALRSELHAALHVKRSPDKIHTRAPGAHLKDHGALPAPAVVTRTNPTPLEAVEVIKFDVAAGDGPVNLDRGTPLKPLWFRKGYLSRNDIDRKESMVISVRGHSMKSTLPHGSDILVDRSRKLLLPEHTYLMTTDEGLIVRRVIRSKGEWWLRCDSDSENWPDMPWPDSANIIGEVKWTGRLLVP